MKITAIVEYKDKNNTTTLKDNILYYIYRGNTLLFKTSSDSELVELIEIDSVTSPTKDQIKEYLQYYYEENASTEYCKYKMKEIIFD